MYAVRISLLQFNCTKYNWVVKDVLPEEKRGAGPLFPLMSLLVPLHLAGGGLLHGFRGGREA